MRIQESIYNSFSSSILERPVFYSNPGGLRFELSTGGTYLDQFLTAHNKANEICSYIFRNINSFILCISFYGNEIPLNCLKLARQLKEAELWPKIKKEHWFTPEEDPDEDEDTYGLHYIAFEISTDYLVNVLWCALSSDFGVIKPSPLCSFHLFDLTNKVHIFPYDDRGMDIVGPNHKLLEKLYFKFEKYLLDYDLEAMKETFT
jgi:hypothetical protein